jgi:hypothetical protein
MIRAPSLTYLRVIEVDLVAVVVAALVTGIAEHAGLVLLAVLADPDDIVLLERVLADLVRRHVPQPLHLGYNLA